MYIKLDNTEDSDLWPILPWVDQYTLSDEPRTIHNTTNADERDQLHLMIPESY